MLAQQDQELAHAVTWLSQQLNVGPCGMAPVQALCILVTSQPAEDLRRIDPQMLKIVQRLAWLGLTRSLDAYTQKREDEQWA